MAGHRRNIDDLLAAELACGKTLAAAAQAVGCGEKTARRRWANPDFRARVATLRAELISRTTGMLAEAINQAANTLRELLTDPDSRIRLGAAVRLLELAVKYHDATKPANPQHERECVIEYVHRVITTTPAAPPPGQETKPAGQPIEAA